MHRFAFCTIEIQSKKVVEVIIKGNIDVTPEMVDEFLAYLSQHMGDDITLIINKATQYTYRFDALAKFSVSSVVRNVAIITYDKTSRNATELNVQKINHSGKRIEIFSTRQEALDWADSITV